MADKENQLKKVLEDIIDSNPTFSEKMIKKVREELINAAKLAENHFNEKSKND